MFRSFSTATCAFISSDFRSISVDEGVFERYLNRYRFSLAHEAAHAILHREYLSKHTFRTVAAYKAFLSGVSDREINRMEWQAYSFAGLVLVPSPEFERRFWLGAHLAEENGISLSESWDATVEYISSWVADYFAVSSQVIEKRAKLAELYEEFIARGKRLPDLSDLS